MIEYIALVIFIIVIIAIWYIIRNTKQCIVDSTLYPEMKIFITDKDLVVADIFKAIKSDTWTDILVMNHLMTSIQKKSEVLKIIRTNYQNIFSSINTIKYFCFIVKNVLIKENISVCPDLIRLINSIPNVYNASIVCVNQFITADFYKSNLKQPIKRCIIPILGSGDAGIIINGNVLPWDNIYNSLTTSAFNNTFNNNGYLVINDCDNHIWNNTSFNRYLIIIDMATIF